MIRTLTLSELEQEHLYCDLIECHRQIWQNGRSWNGYTEVPRFADGLMLVCSRAQVTFSDAEGHCVTATKGNVIYAPTGCCYRVDFKDGGSDPDLFTVNFRLWDAQGNAIRLGDSIRLLVSAAMPDCKLIASDLSMIWLDPRQNKLHLQARFFDFLAAVGDSVAFQTEEFDKIREGVRLLRNEWDQNERMDRYAAACGMSESSFYQYFRRWSGFSPNEYRIRMRVSAARSMLRNSALAVHEVAFRVGFTDPYYFSRCFCKVTGLSPRAYRRAGLSDAEG